MAYRHTAISSLPRTVLVISVISLTILLVAWFSWCLLPICSHCSLHKAAHPQQLPDKVPVSPVVPPWACFPHWWGQKFWEWSVLLCLWLLLHCKWSLLSFHNVQALIFWFLTEDPTIHFMISSPVIFPKILLDVLSPLRCSSFFKSEFLMLLLHSTLSRCLFLNVHPFWVPCTTLSLLGPWLWPLWGAGIAWRAIPQHAGAHHRPESVPSADCGILWLDADPHASSSVLIFLDFPPNPCPLVFPRHVHNLCASFRNL